jgi:hypothetical protein
VASDSKPVPAMVIDLRGLRQADRRGKSVLYLVLGGTIGLSIEELLLVGLKLQYLEKGGIAAPAGQLFVFGVAAAALLIIVGLSTVPAYLPGASVIAIEPDGIRLAFSGRRSHFLGFHDPRCRFQLRDYSQARNGLNRRRTYLLDVPYVRGSWLFRRPSVLTKGAHEAILAAAREHGLRISIRTTRLVGGGPPMVAHRVLAGPRGP